MELFENKRKFNLEFKKREIKNLPLVNEWLDIVFDIKENSIQNSIEVLSKKASFVILKLLQICQIPVFEIPKIISLSDINDTYKIELEIEYIDNTPIQYYISIINSSFMYIYLMMENKPTIQNKEHLINKIINELVNKILINMPKGKHRVTILEYAYNMNIPFLHLGSGIYQLGYGKNSTIIDRSANINDSMIGTNISINKISTTSLLKNASLPTPKNSYTNDVNIAIKIANEIKYPIVVKPIDTDRSIGVSVNITNDDELIKAFDIAKMHSNSKNVVIEEQIKGVCHRLFIVDGELLYCVKRKAIGVYANGIDTISKLIDKANQKESQKSFWEDRNICYKDNLTQIELSKQNYSLNTIPKDGEFVPLRDIESTQWGGIDIDMTNTIHKENIKIAIKATRLLNLTVAGVDIISEDISIPWYQNGAIINEVNYAPLLGGGEISRQNIKKYLNKIVNNCGKIPIEEYNDFDIARQKQLEYINSNKVCYLVSSEIVLDENLEKVIFTTNDIKTICKSLVLDTSIEAMVIKI